MSAVSAASAPYPGVKQRCWRPRLAASKEPGKQHPTDAGVQGWAKGGRARWERASGAGPLPAYRDAQPQREAQEWRALWAPSLGEQETAPQAVVCRRVEQYRSALLVCVGTPLVPATNTAAERSLRPPVIARKIRGGRRAPAGPATTMTLASIFGTWRVRGRNPVAECLRLLAVPSSPA